MRQPLPLFTAAVLALTAIALGAAVADIQALWAMPGAILNHWSRRDGR